MTGTISGAGYQLDIGTGGQLTLAPSSPNTFGSLRLSGGTLILGNTNAMPPSTPLIMNGSILRLDGNDCTPSSYQHLSTSSYQSLTTVKAAQLILPLEANATFNGFAEANSVLTHSAPGVKPLHVTLNGRNDVVATFSQSVYWSGNLTNNGVYLTTAGTRGFGTLAPPPRQRDCRQQWRHAPGNHQ